MAPFTNQNVWSPSLPGTYSHLKMARSVKVWEEAGLALRLPGAGAVFGFDACTRSRSKWRLWRGDPGLFEVRPDSMRGPAQHHRTSAQAPPPPSWREPSRQAAPTAPCYRWWSHPSCPRTLQRHKMPTEEPKSSKWANSLKVGNVRWKLENDNFSFIASRFFPWHR